jgi:hypothetical protein
MRKQAFGIHLLMLPLAALALTGCSAYSELATPNVHMRVLDAETHQPIEGAVVTVTADVDPDLKAVGRTDQRGMVHLPALDHNVWGPGAPLANPDPHPYPEARILVEAPRYQPLTFRSTDAGGTYMIGSQPVVLTPAP